MLGATREEVNAFINIALGFAPPGPGRPPMVANLLIIDQHLTFESEEEGEIEMLGSNLVVEIEQRGFEGVICIHSGSRE